MEDGKTHRVGWRECCLSRRMGRKARVLVLETHLCHHFIWASADSSFCLLPTFLFPSCSPSLLYCSSLSSLPTTKHECGWERVICQDWSGRKSCTFLIPSLLMYYKEWRKAHKYLTFCPTINVAFSKIKVLSIYKGYLERNWKASYLFKSFFY